MANVSGWRKKLLILEFSSLAVLVGSMAYFRHHHSAANPIDPAWLLIPALASLLLFLSFLGLMYLRWTTAAADAPRQGIQRFLLVILSVTLLALWAFAIGKTWQSIQHRSDHVSLSTDLSPTKEVVS